MRTISSRSFKLPTFTSWLGLLALGLALVTSIAQAEAAKHTFIIGGSAHRNLRGQDAMHLLQDQLRADSDLEQRLLDPEYTVPREDWGYRDQHYRSAALMHYLIAKQIKAMAETGKIKKVTQLFDPEYGIGSKNHKDKGTIGNVFSFWGHPVQKEILGGGSRLKTLKVYTAFRITLKNELIRYARSRPLHWHQQSTTSKLQEVKAFLKNKYPEKTHSLREQLKALDYNLDTLLRRAIASNLIS
ncbi:MAG: hypothetical protein AAGC73_02905 [Verrucomicrobiota bacterium]